MAPIYTKPNRALIRYDRNILRVGGGATRAVTKIMKTAPDMCEYSTERIPFAVYTNLASAEEYITLCQKRAAENGIELVVEKGFNVPQLMMTDFNDKLLAPADDYSQRLDEIALKLRRDDKSALTDLESLQTDFSRNNLTEDFPSFLSSAITSAFLSECIGNVGGQISLAEARQVYGEAEKRYTMARREIPARLFWFNNIKRFMQSGIRLIHA